MSDNKKEVYAVNPFKIPEGETETGLIFIKKLEVKPKRTNGVYGEAEGYFKGKIYPIKIWDANIINTLKNVSVFLGTVKSGYYNNTLQITVENVLQVNPEGVDETYFFDEVDSKKVEILREEVLSKLGKYKDLYIDIMQTWKSAFENAPAAKSKHDSKIRGLEYHSLKVAKIAMFLADIYGFETEFLGLCGLLHDIGKIIELSAKTIDYTIQGMVQTHRALGIRMLATKKDVLSKYLDKFHIEVLYGVVENHHGHEYGGTPSTLEAHLIHLADLVESRLEIFYEHILHKIELKETMQSAYLMGNYFFVGGHEFKKAKTKE